MEIKHIGCPSSNFRQGRPAGHRPEAIVIHIMDGSFAAGESVFLDPSTQKSAHYGISTVGEVHQYVDESDTAFHAGIVVRPQWQLLKPGVNPNFYTIGIEHAGKPDDIWPDIQLATSTALIGEIASRWGIPLDDQHIIPHHIIRASKTCPGNWLDMQSLIRRVPRPRSPSSLNFSSVHLLKNVNLRRGAPNVAAPIIRVISAGTQIRVAGFTVGQNIAGNNSWYVDNEWGFFWAGATDVPSPATGNA
jgi:N-acetylmuramoyl-L-alanine amidase